MSQGKRLKDIIQSLLESPKSFSDGIGLTSPTTIYDVISDKREITPALLKRIIDTYPLINPDWLLKGTLPKLLTERVELNDVNIAYEKTGTIRMKCHSCQEKDIEIAKLSKDLIELQKQYIDLLKEVSDLRKTSSG
jgi:hypothetical protein